MSLFFNERVEKEAMEFEVSCKCGSALTVGDGDVFSKIRCPYCGNSYLLGELDSELYDLYFEKRKNEFEIGNQTLKKYSGTGGKIMIPKDVLTVADRAFLRNGTVEGVVCPSELKYIGASAFQNCFGLKEAVFGNGLETIGNGAFVSCTGLGKIEIPSSVALIDEEAFMGCKGITRLTFSPDAKTVLGKSAFEGLERLSELELFDGMKVESHAFLDCTNLEKLVLNGTVALSDGAFAGCKKLTVYVASKKGFGAPKWFNQKAFPSNVKVVWNYHK